MKMVSNVDCYRDDYQGEKPNWLQDLTPANYDDYEAIWLTVNFYDLTDMLFDVTEQVFAIQSSPRLMFARWLVDKPLMSDLL